MRNKMTREVIIIIERIVMVGPNDDEKKLSM